ncbi:glycosyl transferase family 10 (putative fucosyltransferase) [Geothermobacter ehrlichii]|uniref:Glycosyl transferase family 10 (Putative fucosyltransferase) n=1 Tax=Geothermobacter ehrlichii TaxID=213224 RepID=A0A5D3WM37_9BACT|nr:glycosyltransferase family 10 [Geothermobacter ehrlichii]TYP00053.1 glycosyl transferase family 10 (putative fucosyltransferase) [Geothermobacter ehrlichii]
MTRAVKCIAAVDSQRDFIENILAFVDDRYDFVWTDGHKADYVFHSIDGYDVLKCPGVRIFVTGENVTPDFAVSDYAMAFEKLSFADRYVWLPLIRLYRRDYAALLRPRKNPDEVARQKTDFCAYVMSNTRNSAEERVRIFELLSQYRQVNSGGSWRNNVGGPVTDKHAFQARHKFAIAFENCSHPGYLTEKFAQAAAVDAIPIYWGDPDIANIFNPRAFVNCHQFASLEAVVEEVRRIDQDEELYKSMLAQPWFRDGREPESLRAQTYATFLANIFDQPLPLAFRRNRSRWGLKRERQLYDMYHRPQMQAYRQMRRAWRRFWRLFLPRRKKY